MRILLADDDDSVRRVFQFKMVKRGHDVTTAEDGQQALDRLAEETFDLMVSDIRMPKVDGIELLAKARRVQPDLKVILITAHATVVQAVEAVKLGAFDYITKPFDDDEFFAVIDKVVAFRRLEEENQLLRGRLQESESGKQLMGVSKPFKEMMRMVERIATTDATVLLTGDSGT
ncbi:MAG: sigma-54-dependent Fis family transcriptional regulator, partial [Candidatus Krumholzibacteriota bacterium]|nr:sigma-54-dependent Fis family transcriptional regulator [Candidatus Krumholzibacteriota bacterium]